MMVAMYVDKKLSGIAAVQSVSRLNRVIPGKDQTFVLDFVNEPEMILVAFQNYYEDSEIQDAPTRLTFMLHGGPIAEQLKCRCPPIV
ncbi:hypothetical protein [Arthrobacter psychrochitiniphilus]|uniref:hypothetical protein n=1 Tax=Arthrobacter psychrochitiniphilus TaxID=291045 RepID=UPI0017BEB071|nr:hypothetical protein [Arthrobacter psychrochitiniphilus]NYG16059.1 type I site-specific restriction-modification system R (restriction) subunit [Arthrobacter psychrochitiniphilus]